MSEDECQGWSNRETWATNLWIENDEGLCSEVMEMTRESDIRRDIVGEFVTVGEFADRLEEWIENLLDFRTYRAEFGGEMPDSLRIMREDIGSLYRVNYWELAEYWISKLQEA